MLKDGMITAIRILSQDDTPQKMVAVLQNHFI